MDSAVDVAAVVSVADAVVDLAAGAAVTDIKYKIMIIDGSFIFHV